MTEKERKSFLKMQAKLLELEERIEKLEMIFTPLDFVKQAIKEKALREKMKAQEEAAVKEFEGSEPIGQNIN